MDRHEVSIVIQHLLRLKRSPIAIKFVTEKERVPDLPCASEWVPSSCAFWGLATQRTFSTRPEQHLNCSIGAVTHGVRGPEEVMPGCGCKDVDLLVTIGRVTEKDLKSLPHLRHRPSAVAYGPLELFPVDPDLVLFFTEAKGAQMVLDAARRAGIPVELQGMPTCAGIPMALLERTVVIGLGCSTSRLRAFYGDHELVVFVPFFFLERLLGALESIVLSDRMMVVEEPRSPEPHDREPING